MYHNLFIHSSTEGEVLAILNKAAINIHLQIFVLTLSFQLLVLKETAILPSKVVCTILHPH